MRKKTISFDSIQKVGIKRRRKKAQKGSEKKMIRPCYSIQYLGKKKTLKGRGKYGNLPNLALADSYLWGLTEDRRVQGAASMENQGSEKRVELGVCTVWRSSQVFLIEWSWQARGVSLGLLSAGSAARPITDTTKSNKCHFPSRGRSGLPTLHHAVHPPKERFTFLNMPCAPR